MTKKDISIGFTGKMVVIVELEESGPMEFSIDDMELTIGVVRLLLGTDNNFPVNSYTEEEGKTLQKLLEK